MANVNLVKGVIFKAELPVFSGSWRRPKFSHNVTIVAEIVRESYGSEKVQHTFTFKIIESSDENEYKVGKEYRKKGRNLYSYIVEVLALPLNYKELGEEKAWRKKSLLIDLGKNFD